MRGPMTPSEKREHIEDLDESAVCRDRMTGETFDRLQEAETVGELRSVLLDLFEPSQETQ